MKELPHPARMFIVVVMLIAASVTIYAIGLRMPADTREFLVLLAMAIVAARFKVTIPGFESNMSMNLPFMLLAIAELSMPEAIAIAAASTFVQTLPQSGQTVKPAQAIFNVCNMVNAVAIASLVGGRMIHLSYLNKPFLIASAAFAFFMADTIPVAVIIAMTGHSKAVENWTEIALMTFPYFVLSAGLACIVAMGVQVIGWTAGVATLLVMLGVYRCFLFYFSSVRSSHSARVAAGSAASADWKRSTSFLTGLGQAPEQRR